jgi:citrate synthase
LKPDAGRRAGAACGPWRREQFDLYESCRHIVGTDTYSAFAAAMSSLKGPRHGGANIKVMEMMKDIKRHVPHWEDDKALKAYLTKMLDGKVFDGNKLIYGLGHAVYTKTDPRLRSFPRIRREAVK